MIFDIHSDIFTDVNHRRLQGESRVFNQYHRERLSRGGINGGIFVLWVDPPYDRDPIRRLEEILISTEKEILEFQDTAHIVKHFDDIQWALDNHVMPLILGLEGMSGFGTDIQGIYRLYDLGLRHASLTWNEANAFATGVGSNEKRGLTPLGQEMIHQMETLGILLDVSHLNEKSFWDVIRVAQKPVIASHSNARALCDVPRNLTDDQVRAIAQSGGLVGVNAYHEFIDVNPEGQHLRRFVDHIEHIVSLVGMDHVALGFDFIDYLQEETRQSFSGTGDRATRGLEDASKARDVTGQLQARGYKDADIQKITHENIFRVLKSVIL